MKPGSGDLGSGELTLGGLAGLRRLDQGTLYPSWEKVEFASWRDTVKAIYRENSVRESLGKQDIMELSQNYAAAQGYST